MYTKKQKQRGFAVSWHHFAEVGRKSLTELLGDTRMQYRRLSLLVVQDVCQAPRVGRRRRFEKSAEARTKGSPAQVPPELHARMMEIPPDVLASGSPGLAVDQAMFVLRMHVLEVREETVDDAEIDHFVFSRECGERLWRRPNSACEHACVGRHELGHSQVAALHVFLRLHTRRLGVLSNLHTDKRQRGDDPKGPDKLRK